MLSARNAWIVVVWLVALVWMPWSLVFKGLGELRQTWTSKRRR